MKRFASVLMVAGLGFASLPSVAMDVAQGARVGVGVGSYTGEANVFGYTNTGTLIAEVHDKNTKVTYGGELGYTLNLSDFYADLGLNMLRVQFQDENLWRTDLLFTVGYYLNENWSLFAGVRRGWQGDGIFNDDAFSEFGPYVGLGFGGIGLGSWGTLNMSAAYNFDKVSDFPDEDDDLDYPGVSLKLGLNFRNTPHSIQLRLQRFDGDDSVTVFDPNTGAAAGRVDFDLSETWVVLSYVFTLAW